MRRLFALTSLLLLLAACVRTQPILNIENADVFTGSGKEATQAEVRKAIVQGLVAKAWRMKEIDANTIEATNGKKRSIAKIRIKYATDKYSINYVDSTKLLYRDGRIHRRYNAWIKFLRNKIDGYLALL